MRTWRRAVAEMFCGSCRTTIRRGEPVLEIRFRGPLMSDGAIVAHLDVKTPKVRCSKYACAGEAIPENLPELVERAPVARPTSLMHVGPDMLPLDFKTRQGGA